MLTKKPTVADIRANKGKHTYTMLRVENWEELAAAESAGVEMVSVPPEMILQKQFREIAPNVFVVPGKPLYEMGTSDDILRWAFSMINSGADAIYCAASFGVVRRLADEAVPVIGHVGLIPSKCTWTGGFKAVGKTAAQAQEIWEMCKLYEQAGAFGVEIEVVPPEVTKAISARTPLFMISMGGGKGGDCQYLFACDVLGTNTGHKPRHSKQYANLAAEFARIQSMRVEAFKTWVDEVQTGAWPVAPYVVKAPEDEMQKFITSLGKERQAL
jgi:3-methyl-2-oxobutanoate hydroxymethyltransferase